MNKLSKTQFKSWQGGSQGFFNWLNDVQPHVPSTTGKYIPFEPLDFQRQHITQALATNEQGLFRYGTLVLSYPRRHSKTTICALLVLWRFCTRTGENIVCLANSSKQSASISFGLVRKIVLNTPFLRDFIGRENIYSEKLVLEVFNNLMISVPFSESSLYGQKISCGWVSEIHAAHSDDPMQVLASSLGDTLDSWLIVDSTVDAIGGALHKLQTLSETGEDETIFLAMVQYENLQDALDKSPHWIRKDWLKSRHKQLLPATFSTQHLNQRSESDSSLFAGADIEACKERLPLPFTIQDLKHYACGRSFACGGGLDRAYAFSLHGDNTIWTSVAKIATEGGESEYLVLNQESIFGSLASGIKKSIVKDNRDFRLNNVCIESYNSQDIAVWAIEQAIPCETIHATTTAQQPAFLELHRIVKEGRLKFSDKLEGLASEMSTFLYELVKGSPRFGSDKFRDDRVYSLAWAVHSLRQKELATYELKSILCNSSSSHANLCFLRGGDAILFCSETCPTYAQTLGMFNQYKNSKIESELTLPSFFQRLVKVNGVRIVR